MNNICCKDFVPEIDLVRQYSVHLEIINKVNID